MKNMGGIQVPETEEEKVACRVRIREIEKQRLLLRIEHDNLVLALDLAKIGGK